MTPSLSDMQLPNSKRPFFVQSAFEVRPTGDCAPLYSEAVTKGIKAVTGVPCATASLVGTIPACTASHAHLLLGLEAQGLLHEHYQTRTTFS